MRTLNSVHRWIEYCLRKASERVTPIRYRVHSVLIRGGSVLAEGQNESPIDGVCAQIVHPNAPEWMGIHSEIDCLRRATPDQLEGATLFVGAVKPNGGFVKSKPCGWCWGALEDSGIKEVGWMSHAGSTVLARIY